MQYTALFPGLVEIVEQNGEPAFLIKRGEAYEVLGEVEGPDGQVFRPPPREKIPWLLPRAVEVLKYIEADDDPEALYNDLLTYFQAASELPGPGYYHLQVAWAFHTYILEAVYYSPEICFYSTDGERGKTRTGKAMIYVARRGVHVESLRDAYLVRLAHNFQATIFFDCLDLWRKAEKAGCEDIILGRFERGITVPRVLYPERGAHQDTVFYEVFGPTIISTNVAVHHILETRAIQINMLPAKKSRFEHEISPKDALPLKERLTAWRARHLGAALPDCQKPAPGRLGDILKPLLQVLMMVNPAVVPEFRALISKIEKTRRIDKATSLDAQIALTVAGLEEKVVRGILPVKLITDTFNENRPEREQFTYQRMGRRLRGLGFEPAQTPESAAAIVWNRQKLERILSSYGLQETSETSESSGTSDGRTQASSDDTDISDDTDVWRGSYTADKTSSYPEGWDEAAPEVFEL